MSFVSKLYIFQYEKLFIFHGITKGILATRVLLPAWPAVLPKKKPRFMLNSKKKFRLKILQIRTLAFPKPTDGSTMQRLTQF